MESSIVISYIYPPQNVADSIALTAQKYVGYFTGHPTRVEQWPTPIKNSCTMEPGPWREPIVVIDKCIFCVGMTNADVIRRVDGFQAAIDKETLGRKWQHFSLWCKANGMPNFPTTYAPDNWKLWRRYITETQDLPRVSRHEDYYGVVTESQRPEGWNVKAFPICDLPFKLKRKLCIEWNHVYTYWMRDECSEEINYDFEAKLFYVNEEGEVDA